MSEFFMEGFSVLVSLISADAVLAVFLLFYLIVFFVHLKSGCFKILGIIYLSLYLLESSFFIAKFSIVGLSFTCLTGAFISVLFLTATVFSMPDKKTDKKSLADRKNDLRRAVNKEKKIVFGRQFSSVNNLSGLNFETKNYPPDLKREEEREETDDFLSADFLFAEKIADKLSAANLNPIEKETVEGCKKIFRTAKEGGVKKEVLSEATTKIIRLLSKYKL